MLNLKQLTSTFLSTTKAAAINGVTMAKSAGVIASVATVAATGVTLAKSSKHTAKAAAAMSKGSERLAAWLYKHVPVVAEPSAPSCAVCGSDKVTVNLDGKLLCAQHVPDCTPLPTEAVQNMAMTGADGAGIFQGMI